MTLMIELPLETEEKLRRRAAASGHDVTTYLHKLIEDDVRNTRSEHPEESAGSNLAPGSAGMRFDEILAPFRQEVEESRMTDDELEQFFREVRDEVRREKRASQGGPA